jgi:hypothetical protein
MKKFMLLALSGVALAMLSQPPVAKAQSDDALAKTAQAVKELTDFPALGKRTTVDLSARGGADVGQIRKAAGLFQEALASAKSGGADAKAVHQLEMALAYAKTSQHKESRLSGEGALFYLCKQNNGEPKATCDTAPKFGSYAAP